MAWPLLLGLAWAAPGEVGISVPLYAMSNRCNDARFPQLAGPWVVGCGPGGEVDRVLSLETGREFQLPVSHDSPGIGPSVVFVAGVNGGAVRLTLHGPVMVEGGTRTLEALAAPSVTNGTHVAVLKKGGEDDQGGVQLWGLTTKTRLQWDAKPMGWQAPAIAWPWVAWVDDDGNGVSKLWAVQLVVDEDPSVPARALSPRALGMEGQEQRHVVGHERWLAWVEGDGIWRWDTESDKRSFIKAETGFSAGLTLWRDVVCWEDRAGDDIDVQCSDGVKVQGKAHQRWPSRWGDWLLYREQEKVMLYTVDEEQ